MIARGGDLWVGGSGEYPLPFADFSSMRLTRRELDLLFVDYGEVGVVQGIDKESGFAI